jgi:hypothetical protein
MGGRGLWGGRRDSNYYGQLKTGKLLFLRKDRNAKNATYAEVRYTAGTWQSAH